MCHARRVKTNHGVELQEFHNTVKLISWEEDFLQTIFVWNEAQKIKRKVWSMVAKKQNKYWMKINL